MARTKQTATLDPPEAMPEALAFATRGSNIIKDRLLEMEIVQSDEQTCKYLSLKYHLARTTRNGIRYLEEELNINSLKPTLSLEDIQKITTGLEAMRKELSTVLGEIPLIICPVKNCPTHINGTKNDSYVAESSSKINDNSSTEQNIKDANNIKEKAPEKIASKNAKNDKDNSQNKKRPGQEDFQAPKKFARKIVEIPIEKVVCTSQNKFAVLEDEEGMDTSTPTPRIKPIMMKINKNYNLILQEIYRSYPNTKNKNTGNYIKIQPATAEDDDNIKKLLITKKADHYTVEHPTVIKAVIKGLPSSTNVTDIETELKAKGFDVEKIAQLRKFSTKTPPTALHDSDQTLGKCTRYF
ncbi:uncharacterized protein TNCV_4279871 [Trichonephila clavipes]|nr:uncharacterized protein TNCV_4279871 [Trichonephila clavipes]